MNFIYKKQTHNNQVMSLILSLLLITGIQSISFGQAHEMGHMHETEAVVPNADTLVTEDDIYKLITIPIPENVILEVGGLALMPNGDLAAATRRGEVWIISNPYLQNGSQPYFKRFAYGLHEALGLEYTNGAFYTAQRGELTLLKDIDGDGKADVYKKVAALPVSGNYHEYSHGPVLLPDGSFWINLNLAHNDHPLFGEMAPLTKWRGWAIKVTPEGKLIPIAAGLRSPAGLGLNAEGDMFYSENQGGWMASGFISHVESGDFMGHPGGLLYSELPGSPVKTRLSDINQKTDGLYPLMTKTIPGFKRPAVWLPHGIMGTSSSEIITDKTGGKFGPFEGQIFVGDQGHSKINRVFLEKVNGKYQGAAFGFREGFASGVLRMEWGMDGSLFAGMTDRGWTSTGPKRFGIQQVAWTGKMPFEIKTMKAKPDGFELEFTMPVNKAKVEDLMSYKVTSFTYNYHRGYGSPIMDMKNCPVHGIEVSTDGMKARVVVDSIREGYIHEFKAEGIRSAAGHKLLHNVGYYTLNNIPEGEKFVLKNKPATIKQTIVAPTKTKATVKPEAPKATPATGGSSTGKRTTKIPASWTNGPDKTLIFATKPGMQFDITTFEVKPGAKIKLTFTDNDDMQHNLVVLQPNSADEIGEIALNMGLEGPGLNYVPKSDKVIAHTKLLSPGDTDTIYFTAPDKPGNYPYICTYPGHYTVMRGVMKVVGK
jgi:azurin/glucose/arabinose dehydrogenase